MAWDTQVGLAYVVKRLHAYTVYTIHALSMACVVYATFNGVSHIRPNGVVSCVRNVG